MIEMYSMKREGEKTYSEGSKLCTCTEMKRMLWSGQRHMNGVSDRLQIDKTSRTACQKNKTEELADIYCMPHSWKIPKFQPLLKISLHCQDERVREFFLNDYYIYYFLVSKSMLRPYWTKTTEYRVSSNEGPRSYHVNQAPQFYLSSLS